MKLTGKKFSNGIEGCISDLRIIKEGYDAIMHVNLWESSLDAVNVLNCVNWFVAIVPVL